MRIEFKILRRGVFEHSEDLLVDPTDPSPMIRMAQKHLRKHIGFYDRHNQALDVKTCFEQVTEDGSNLVHLIPDWELTTMSNTWSDPNGEDVSKRNKIRSPDPSSQVSRVDYTES